MVTNISNRSSGIESLNVFNINNVHNNYGTGLRSESFQRRDIQTAGNSPSFGGFSPSGALNSVAPSDSVLTELEQIAQEIGDDSLIKISRGPDGRPNGIAVNYDPKRVGDILLRLARSGSGASIVSNLRRLLGLLEAGRFVGLRVSTIDGRGVETDSGLLQSSSTVIGSTNQLIAPGTQGFNAFSRASEVILAWLDILAVDPTTIQSDTVNIAGTQISRSDIQDVNDALRANPEIPAALRQFASTLENINRRQEQNIQNAQNLRDINQQLAQPNAGGGGGGQRR